MSDGRQPGPLGLEQLLSLDEGTMCVARSPVPGPLLTSKEAPPAYQSYTWSHPTGFEPSTLCLSLDGLALLMSVEQLRLLPYDDQTDKTITAWCAGATIGYGHLISANAWSTYAKGIDESAAVALLLSDVAPFEQAVRDAISVGLQQYQFDALVIFAFNIGAPSFAGSSVVKLINDPKAKTPFTSLESAWKAWNKAQGQVMAGLDNRRACEWKIYTRAVYERW